MTGAWGLPMQAELGGVRYAIRSDYRDVLELLPGVTGAEINPRIGTVLIRYDANITAARAILRWVGIVVDEGIRISNEDIWQGADEKELEDIVRKRLILRLPQQKEG